MAEAERTRNLDAVLDLIREGAVWLAPNTPAVIGAAGIPPLFAVFFELPFSGMTVGLTGVRVSESGDMATVWGTFALTFDAADGGSTETMSFLMSWEKRDGAWKAAANMFCSHAPLPEAQRGTRLAVRRTGSASRRATAIQNPRRRRDATPNHRTSEVP